MASCFRRLVCSFVPQSRTHELLTRVTSRAFRLRIALCHSLLLRADLGAGLAEDEARWGRGPPNGRSDLHRAVKSLAFGVNDLCATGSLFSDQSKRWVLFHKIAQLPKAIIARVEIGQQP